MTILALIAIGIVPAATTNEATSLPGFHGTIEQVEMVEGSQVSDLSSDAPASPDMDLTAMARWALEALKKNPRPDMNYECRFHMSLLAYPPCPLPGQHDGITDGDTENRMDWEFGYMKDMCDDASADVIAKGVRNRILGHLRDDGLCWVSTAAFSRLPGIWANHGTTGRLLISFCEDYGREPDEALRARCRKIFEGLRDRADWVDGRAYYAGGNSCWNEQGWAITDASPYSPSMPLTAIVTYYDTFKDEDALEFAMAFAKGEMHHDQWEHWVMRDPEKLSPEQKEQVKLTSSIEIWPTAPMSANMHVRADGSFDHHSHIRGHQGWGMAYLAALTQDPELIGWSKRLLDFYVSRGTDYGWIPESMTYPRRSETCAVADVISMATYVAQCGYPEYWDVVERFVRNYIRQAQFFFTPEYEALYRKLHPGEEGDKGLALARDLQGGFLGAIGIADCCYQGTTMDMMGCCVPEGMRSIYTAWRDTVIQDGNDVYVNMCFDRDAPEARVSSFLPHQGRMTVEAKASGTFHLRPPAWVDKDALKAYRSQAVVEPNWNDGYVLFGDVDPGDRLSITYPLPKFVQKQTVKNAPGEPDRDLTITWLGNTVVEVTPKGPQLPLYQGIPGPVPPLPKK